MEEQNKTARNVHPRPHRAVCWTKRLVIYSVRLVSSILELLYNSEYQVLNDNTQPDRPILVLINARLAYEDPKKAQKLWRVECRGGRVAEIREQKGTVSKGQQGANRMKFEVDCTGSLVLPSLCHPHVHIDKCFILERCGDLVDGDFDEAMRLTAKAKESFPRDSVDLYTRGVRLISESVEAGVTSMRAHVEVDTTVGFTCLDTALLLKGKYTGLCDIYISVFAQEPLFLSASDTEPGPNYDTLIRAISKSGISSIGSAPYVEPSLTLSKRNISLILHLASTHGLHADFHLDYNVDPISEPLIYELIDQMRNGPTAQYWLKTAGGLPQYRVTIGHATRLQLFTPGQWKQVLEDIGELPITFVGLPQSDMYMMGRGDAWKAFGAPRGTLRVTQLARDYGVQVAMGVNNVLNPFTPQGSMDPLSLCVFGAAVFQAATPQDIRILAQSVTLTSKQAIGQEGICADLFPVRYDPADFVILRGVESLAWAVLSPPHDRTTIKAGMVVSHRCTHRWHKGTHDA